MIDFCAEHPVLHNLLGLMALLGASFGWAHLAHAALATPWRRRANGEMLAGLAACGPILTLTLLQALDPSPQEIVPVSSGSALTYILLSPAMLLAIPAAGSAWATWRRAALPFVLAICVTWFAIPAGGSFNWLKGQFLVTLFILGSWLFALDRTTGIPAPSAVAPLAEPPVAPPSAPGSPLLLVVQPSAPAKPLLAAPSALLLALAGLAAISLSVTGSWLVLSQPPNRLASAAPLAGIVACVGPLVLARRAPRTAAGPWLGALGYAATAAFCLVPGLAIFLPVLAGSVRGWEFAAFFGRVLEPLYMGDATFVALATILLLGLDHDRIASQPSLRRLLVGIWALWVAWVTLSAPGR